MGNLYNKTNAPYLIAGTLATLALLASGTLAVAPYVAFLSSIPAFNVALPVALSLSILSTLILVLSCKMISRNKKLAAQGAELNEKTELAAEQENTIQSLEPQIKGLNKKVSDLETKLDEISKQTNGAATKDEVKQLRGELGSLTEKYNQIANLGEKLDSAATKGAVEKLRGEFAEELKKLNDEVVKLIDSAATKDEVEELSKKFSSFTTKLDEIVKQIGSAATKDEVEELVTKIASAATKEELKAGLNGAATKEELEERFGNFIKEDEVKEELQMNFYGKDEEREKMTLDNVMLPNNIKQKLVRIYQPNALEKREGYILHGPPGTGKTMIARAIASETKGISAFISVSASSLFNIQNIDDLFKKAKENAPCIVFIDEIEGFGKMRNLHGNNVEYLDHFLTKIGGFDSIKDVTVVAATNRISDLDGALTRGGRLSNHINIPPLDTNTRKKIINEHLKETKPDLLKRVLDETKGFSPANLIILLRELEEKKFTSASKVGEFCQHFKKTHGIDNVSNKQRTNEETLNTLEKTPLQETASSLKMDKGSSSEHSSELGKIDKDKFVNELPSLSHMSTPKTKNSTQYRTKPPRKSPKKKDEDENKENSEQLNHENLDTNINSPHLSPFKDTTNNSYYTLTM